MPNSFVRPGFYQHEGMLQKHSLHLQALCLNPVSLFCLYICSYAPSLSSFLSWIWSPRTNCVFLTTSWRRKAWWSWASRCRVWWTRRPPNTPSWRERRRRAELPLTDWLTDCVQQTHTWIQTLTWPHISRSCSTPLWSFCILLRNRVILVDLRMQNGVKGTKAVRSGFIY